MIRRILRVAAKTLGVILAVLIIYFATTFVQIWMRGHEHTTKDAQAILVFGTAAYGAVPSPELKARLDQALHLYDAGRAPLIAVTGGKLTGDAYTEAHVSVVFLEGHGVPRADIIEGGGADTWQNVASVLGALSHHHVRTVITVTDPFHEYRAMAIASAQGLDPYPSPVRNSPTIKYELWRFYLKETLEVGVGRIIGFHLLSEWSTAPLKSH
ncbi:MAG TPA: YdcF family protein [Acidimicrobiales bacterium]